MPYTGVVLPTGSMRDEDRRLHWDTIIDLYHSDKIHFLFGRGMLSSQYDLNRYLTDRFKGTDRIRSTGLTVVFFNGGITLFLLLVLSSMWACYQIIQRSIETKPPLYIILLCVSAPALPIIILPMSINMFDMVIWWLALAPRGLGYVLLETFNARRSGT